MESGQNRKRKAQDSISLDDAPAKKRTPATRQRFATPFPPSFYDNLAEIPLTLNVLRELNRRNEARGKAAKRSKTLSLPTKDLSRFARRGGPDLQHLRQFAIRARERSEMEETPKDPPTPRSAAAESGLTQYGREFEQHLLDHKIYMINRKSTPSNIGDVKAQLEEALASLSPDQFPQEQFDAFWTNNEDALYQTHVMANIFSIICGTSHIPSRQNVLFTELAPITDRNVPRPRPDHFDGSDLEDLSIEVRNNDEVKKKVIPTKHYGVPVAANFFMEVKGREGLSLVAQRQVCYFGAYGARSMNCLQNYGKSQKEYDGNAYTFTSTYHPASRTLELYAHHVTAPPSPGEREEYHMTLIKICPLAGEIADFQRGATAFRFVRELAQKYRTQFIQAANARHIVGDTADVSSDETETLPN
ncbi:hypothetical protein E4U43_004029 [Claviceps pusilla]|uniref:Uncharacterized protein n=1 Tax=Claviceps pusilla TaxID=123648 RepID=A0A9P7NF78_9HYPO|nr:hypothetical protein E4U43_004029 [Claviceps pusilla]